jgi:hypothetical protein
MTNTIGIYFGLFLILGIMLILSFRLSLWMARRAVCRVITIFRDYNAVQFQKALPLESLGLGPRPLISFRLLRDYKPWALQTLVRSGVIRMGMEGNYYLSEDTLNANPEIQSVCRVNVK